MKVGFYHAGDSPIHERLARFLVRSSKKVMPDVPVVHFADDRTAAIDGVDYVQRLESGPIAQCVLEAYVAAGPGDWLFVDTDVVIREDVRKVFDDTTFAIAVAERAGTLKESEIGTKFMANNPFNKGAVFSRSQEFWATALEHIRQMKPARQAWMGDQIAMCEVIALQRFAVSVLPSRYNYPPFSPSEDLRDKAILHYKGARKQWLVAA